MKMKGLFLFNPYVDINRQQADDGRVRIPPYDFQHHQYASAAAVPSADSWVPSTGVDYNRTGWKLYHHQQHQSNINAGYRQSIGNNNAVSKGGAGGAVYSRSVTLTARMAPGGGSLGGGSSDDAAASVTTTSGNRDARWSSAAAAEWWRVTSERLPLVVGVFCGGFLVTLTVLLVVLYRCCIMPRREKHYCVRKGERSACTQIPRAGASTHPTYPGPHQQQHHQQQPQHAVHHTAVQYVDPHGSSYNSRLLHHHHHHHHHQQQQHQQRDQQPSGGGGALQWPCGARIASSPSTGQASRRQQWHTSSQGSLYGTTRRSSINSVTDVRTAARTGYDGHHTPDIVCATSSRQALGQVPRSSSHPGGGPPPPQDPGPSVSGISGGSGRRPRPHSQPVGPCDLLHQDVGANKQIVPQMPQISEFIAPPTVQYASSSILDEVGSREDEQPTSASSTLKTRSLPAWVRSKPRPLSTEDDLNELYAKVNFSKKRKNRMRNDEAAIIALSKSRSQFLHIVGTNRDTDSLVDNEAVIVYDERTAL